MRFLLQDDLEQVVSIQQRITKARVSSSWRSMLAEHGDNPELPGFVAEQDDRVAGFIIGSIKVGGFGVERCGWVETVGVVSEHMGQGMGTALADRMLSFFAANGVEHVFTAVRWDSGDMLAFFKNLGFDRSTFINLHMRDWRQCTKGGPLLT